MNKINTFLNSITMYRLMLYYLLALIVFASILSFLRIIPYSGFDILISAMYLATICKLSNELFAKIFKVFPNIESSLITGFILSLIFGPANFFSIWIVLTVAGVAAMASKYLIAWKHRHIFNPAAFGAFFVALTLHHGASWWIGNSYTFPFVLLGALLILKKIKRFQLVGVFLLAFPKFLFESPILFFASVMLIEPLTSPFNFRFQIIYAILVAVAFNLYARFLPIPLEVALLTGNIFSYMVNGSFRQTLKLKEKIQRSSDVISFLFEPQSAGWRIKFQAGQYLEWTLPHNKPDSRGVRRYFTISSSPTEELIMLSTKFSEKSSTFKSALKNMKTGNEIAVSNLEGDFTLPKDADKKLVFIAGGIGITPFRSMAKHLMDSKERRDIVLLYSNKTPSDIVFKDLFDKAKQVGLRTVYVNTDSQGYVDEAMIKKQAPDWKERIFYASGPEPMVEAFEKMLSKMGLPKSQIKTDFFPGYAE